MSWWVGKDREAFNAELHTHTERIMRSGGKRVPRSVVTQPAQPSTDVAVIDAPRTSICERCHKEFTPKVGVSGRFCSRACYETPTQQPSSHEPEPAPVIAVLEANPGIDVDDAAALCPPSKHQDKTAAYRKRNVAAGKCARCGKPRKSYAYHCDACQAKKSAYQDTRRGFAPWRPGSRGATPKALQPFLSTAAAIRDALNASQEAQDDPALGRAAVIMFAGFFLGQQLDWIVAWTKYPQSECRRVVRNLYRNGIWKRPRRMVCKWLDPFMEPPTRANKKARFEADFSFWLDACVAQGSITRETRDGEHYYGLPEWIRREGAEPGTAPFGEK